VAPNALLMNFKAVRFRFQPDRKAGSVRIRTEPPLANLTIENRLSLAPGPCRGYQRGIEISANEAVDRITFAGRFPARCRHYSLDRSVLGHDAFDYGLVASLWRESGGILEGGWRHGSAPVDAGPLLEFDSLPLAEVIAKINKHSNNVMARQLLYTLSAEVLGEPGTEAGGRRVVADWLEARDLGFSKYAFDNGAGLSRTARMTAREFGALLRFAWGRPYMPEYASSLPLSGLDGTLSRRFRGSPIAGNAHLKTGSLDHVAAIAGYLQSRKGRRFAVAVLQNYTDVHRGPGDEVQEAVLRWLYER
jgi:D-alanyl-D-alanine carboxypeptidase/D-alanyl-D-alanine-endopeptidase (penicillin-binding protein 4)